MVRAPPTVAEQLDFVWPERVVQLKVLPPAPQVASCDRCALRPTCRALCEPMRLRLESEHLGEVPLAYKEIVVPLSRATQVADRRQADVVRRGGVWVGSSVEDPEEDAPQTPWRQVEAAVLPLVRQMIARPSKDRSGLTEAQAEILHLFLVEGIHQAEIARRRQCSKPTVTLHMQRARRKIVQALLERLHAGKMAIGGRLAKYIDRLLTAKRRRARA